MNFSYMVAFRMVCTYIQPPSFEHKVTFRRTVGRPLAKSRARCCLHCRKNEATMSQMNNRLESTIGRPITYRSHIPLSSGSTMRFFSCNFAILRDCAIVKKFRILNFFAIMREPYCVTFHTIMRFPQYGLSHPFALDEHFLASPRASHSPIRAKSRGKSRSGA